LRAKPHTPEPARKPEDRSLRRTSFATCAGCRANQVRASFEKHCLPPNPGPRNPSLIDLHWILSGDDRMTRPGSYGKLLICAKTLRFFSLSGRSKIDFGHFDPMFRL
jgi:hypothetical protein